MSLIDRNLLPDENILFRTKKHMVIFFFPAMLAILAIYFTTVMQQFPFLTKLLWAPALIVLIFFLSSYLEYATSEFVVTNKRVLMREGFFNRHANELRLSAISQVSVDQGVFGQLLNFGSVTLNAFGAYDRFVLISQPFALQKAINEQLDKVTR